MDDPRKVGSQRDRYRALAVTAVGLSHFLWPKVFDPINALGFPNHPRRYTYINGAIETGIGVLMVRPQTRVLSTMASVCYITYLTGNVIRVQQRDDRLGVGGVEPVVYNKAPGHRGSSASPIYPPQPRPRSAPQSLARPRAARERVAKYPPDAKPTGLVVRAANLPRISLVRFRFAWACHPCHLGVPPARAVASAHNGRHDQRRYHQGTR